MSSNKPEFISAEQLARRFGKGMRWAMMRLREMRHTTIGGEMFTTEEWLAEYVAAKTLPAANWPKANLDPLEEAVCSRVIQTLGELARLGRIQVVKV